MKAFCIALCLTLLSSSWPLEARELQLQRGMTYQEAKAWHERFLAGNPTLTERREAMRSLVRTGPVGERGLQRAYGNFAGARSIDPSIPGVEKLALLQRSPNRSQAKGYRRELLYATATYNDPRFDLVELSRAVGKGQNRTDADQVFRDRRTGLYGRIEVKDVTKASQSTNLRKYQRQIDLMAREAARTGQQQAFFNRREIIPELRAYANRRGVFIRGGVVTGRSAAPNTVPYRVAMTDLQQEMVQASRGRAIGGGAGLAFGTWMLVASSPEALRAAQAVWDPTTRTGEAWRRLGEHGSNVVAGGGMALSGGALLASQYAREPLQYRLFGAQRLGTVVSFAALGVGEAFLISRRMNGEISAREFWVKQCQMGATAAGGTAGSWVGGTIGSTGGPVTGGAGAVAGGAGGAYAGGKLGEQCVDYFYSRRFRELDQEFGKAVYARYGVT